VWQKWQEIRALQQLQLLHSRLPIQKVKQDNRSFFQKIDFFNQVILPIAIKNKVLNFASVYCWQAIVPVIADAEWLFLPNPQRGIIIMNMINSHK